MTSYWSEFLLVALAHLVAVASPGPDFAMVLRQSITFGRRPAIWTSVGIGTGIFLHVAYSLLGIGLLVRSSVLAFNILKWLGAIYLAWVGQKAIRAKPFANGETTHGAATASTANGGRETPGRRAAFITGFLTNALNPKATLFFVSLFSVVINPCTPVIIQGAYGIWMALATMGWFILVSLFFSQDRVRMGFRRCGHWFERAMGMILLGLSVRLALATAR
ncbi:MAG: LysE family translocator [Opitutaceae bacterium]|nr:LysE family translocator [Opitutaceae bacterium]